MRRRTYNAEVALTGHAQRMVRFSEVDSMRIVWHGEYARYFEDGREAFGRMYPGIGYMDIMNHGYAAPIVDMHIAYLKPLRVDDVVDIETRYMNMPGARMCFEYLIRKEGNEEVMARGTTMQVFLDAQGEMCLLAPPFYEAWKKKWIK